MVAGHLEDLETWIATRRCSGKLADVSILELKSEMMKLPAEVRAELAEELVESLEISQDEPIQREWIDEAMRRRDEVRSGEVETVPCDQVLAEVRGMLVR